MRLLPRLPLRSAALALGLLVGFLILPRPASADPFTPDQRNQIVQILRDALLRDPSILRDALAALQADEAKRQAQQVLAHQDKLVDPADPVGGNPAGNVTIVEFFDVRCPYCRSMEPDMQKLLAADHSVRVVYKDLPILGPASILASRALLAAQKQGGYLKIRPLLMQGPPDITEASIRNATIAAGLDWPRLRHDMNDPAIGQRLTANLQLAREIGIEGTPALVIGKRFMPGAADFAELQSAVADARTKVADAPAKQD
jgi:protein-disulfide isomerase